MPCSQVTTANEYPQAPEYEQDFPSVPANTGPSKEYPYTATTTKEDLPNISTQGPNTPPQTKQAIAAWKPKFVRTATLKWKIHNIFTIPDILLMNEIGRF